MAHCLSSSIRNGLAFLCYYFPVYELIHQKHFDHTIFIYMKSLNWETLCRYCAITMPDFISLAQHDSDTTSELGPSNQSLIFAWAKILAWPVLPMDKDFITEAKWVHSTTSRALYLNCSSCQVSSLLPRHTIAGMAQLWHKVSIRP